MRFDSPARRSAHRAAPQPLGRARRAARLGRWVRLGAALAAGALLCGTAALAQPAPGADTGRKPLKVLVGFPPGGGTDAIARLLAEPLRQTLGQSVVVENKPGAGGQLAAQALKVAAADGSTVFLSHDHTVTILPLVTRQPGFDPATDFVPVAGFATFVNALAVSGANPARSVAEYVAWVKTQGKGQGTVGVPAPASTPEFLVRLIGQTYGLDLAAAPYRGSAPLMADMLGNQMSAGVASVPDFMENHKAGKLRVIAVLGGQRQAALPDVPTFAELGLSGLEDLPVQGTADELLAHVQMMLEHMVQQYQILQEVADEDELDHISNYADEQITALSKQIWMLKSTLEA